MICVVQMSGLTSFPHSSALLQVAVISFINKEGRTRFLFYLYSMFLVYQDTQELDPETLCISRRFAVS